MTRTLAERLRDAARSGVYAIDRKDALLAAARSAGLDGVSVDLAGARDKRELLGALGAALGFPEWFGGNWDALEDCLMDLSWRNAAGHVLVFENHEALPREALDMLVDILAASAEYWKERGRPFCAAFVDPRARLALERL